MRTPGLDTQTLPKEAQSDQKLAWLKTLLHDLFSTIAEHVDAINGNLTFGDGTDLDNISGKWVTYTTNATPDTEDAVTHNLGQIPPGFLLVKPPNGGFLYRGTTAWSTTTLYLKCSAASKEVTIFVLAAPRTSI